MKNEKDSGRPLGKDLPETERAELELLQGKRYPEDGAYFSDKVDASASPGVSWPRTTGESPPRPRSSATPRISASSRARCPAGYVPLPEPLRGQTLAAATIIGAVRRTPALPAPTLGALLVALLIGGGLAAALAAGRPAAWYTAQGDRGR